MPIGFNVEQFDNCDYTVDESADSSKREALTLRSVRKESSRKSVLRLRQTQITLLEGTIEPLEGAFQFPKLAQRAAISPKRASLALHARLISVACHFLLNCRPSADLQLRWK